MFPFQDRNKISHQQASVVGFVLALISVLITAVLGYGTLALLALLSIKGANELSVFVSLSAGTGFLAVQGLLLFGFPLFYAHDKKSHMTGLQILVFEVLWIFLLSGLLVALGLFL